MPPNARTAGKSRFHEYPSIPGPASAAPNTPHLLGMTVSSVCGLPWKPCTPVPVDDIPITPGLNMPFPHTPGAQLFGFSETPCTPAANSVALVSPCTPSPFCDAPDTPAPLSSLGLLITPTFSPRTPMPFVLEP